ncbi:MAG: hypothetical protein GX765_02310, partial [Candidatus Moranbacteria bacterium]|nr:hypothetical protein [Candidatus Moranbacteria bacterium]
MKKIIFSLIFGIFVGISGIASASTVISIHVEWDYYTPPTELAVTGFRLYREGVSIADFVGADLTQSDCNLVIYSDFRPVQNFTLTVLFADGTESPHSAPYPFSVEGHLHPLPTDGVERLTRNNPYPNLRYRGKGVKM